MAKLVFGLNQSACLAFFQLARLALMKRLAAAPNVIALAASRGQRPSPRAWLGSGQRHCAGPCELQFLRASSRLTSRSDPRPCQRVRP
jgi:hypothetical protein